MGSHTPASSGLLEDPSAFPHLALDVSGGDSGPFCEDEFSLCEGRWDSFECAPGELSRRSLGGHQHGCPGDEMWSCVAGASPACAGSLSDFSSDRLGTVRLPERGAP